MVVAVVEVVCGVVVSGCAVVCRVVVVGAAGGEHEDDTFNSSKHIIITDGM